MLAADKAAVEQQLAVSMLDLQWKESTTCIVISKGDFVGAAARLWLCCVGPADLLPSGEAYSNATGYVVSTADDSIWSLAPST